MIEAAAAGCALVATKTSGAQSIIEDKKNGMLIDVGDENQLTNILVQLKDSELRYKLKLQAQELADSYDAERSVARLIDFWRQVAKL